MPSQFLELPPRLGVKFGGSRNKAPSPTTSTRYIEAALERTPLGSALRRIPFLESAYNGAPWAVPSFVRHLFPTARLPWMLPSSSRPTNSTPSRPSITTTHGQNLEKETPIPAAASHGPPGSSPASAGGADRKHQPLSLQGLSPSNTASTYSKQWPADGASEISTWPSAFAGMTGGG
jgi:hypothetical protein